VSVPSVPSSPADDDRVLVLRREPVDVRLEGLDDGQPLAVGDLAGVVLADDRHEDVDVLDVAQRVERVGPGGGVRVWSCAAARAPVADDRSHLGSGGVARGGAAEDRLADDEARAVLEGDGCGVGEVGEDGAVLPGRAVAALDRAEVLAEEGVEVVGGDVR
jgi:hypothetical protein